MKEEWGQLMIHNFLVCLNAVIPLVLYLVVGMLVRKYSVLTEKVVRKFNKMVFVVFFPALMFENLYAADISEAFDGRLILFACLFVLAVCGITWGIVVRMDIPDRTRGAMIQAVYRSNFILMGLPVAENIYGKGCVSVTAALIMFVVPLYNFLAVIVLEYFRGGRANLKSVLKKILTNPIILGAVAAILALALNQLRFHKLKRVVQTVLYAPHFISTMIICGMLRIFLSPSGGLINLLFGTSIDFLNQSTMFRTIYVASGIWQEAGWGTIIYLATLSSVDTALYEAAKVDGASVFQRILHIDLPALVPMAVLQLILSASNLMNVGFEKVYLLQTDLNKSVSDIIAVYVYEQGILGAEYSYSTAIGLFNTAVNIVLLIIVSRIAKKAGDVQFV